MVRDIVFISQTRKLKPRGVQHLVLSYTLIIGKVSLTIYPVHIFHIAPGCPGKGQGIRGPTAKEMQGLYYGGHSLFEQEVGHRGRARQPVHILCSLISSLEP